MGANCELPAVAQASSANLELSRFQAIVEAAFRSCTEESASEDIGLLFNSQLDRSTL
jgi:hypothetical protein